MDEFKERVKYLYKVCAKNGLSVDRQNCNPSRFSRIPGVFRKENKQYLLDTNIGQKDWESWVDFIEDFNDDLPEIKSFGDVVHKEIKPAEQIIENVLCVGDKMLLAGPSKAGKSFSLLELAVAIAEGGLWFGWPCRQGKVLYINLELKEDNCDIRLQRIYKALNLSPNNAKNIDTWNLRGKARTLDQLAPKLIRRAKKNCYSVIIIDPIYKVITGDENNASEMGKFCGLFDQVCEELNCAVVYAHHHSKGAQGHKKAADRSSGSGVFARDPDVILDMIQLNLKKDKRESLVDDAVRNAICDTLADLFENWRELVTLDDGFPVHDLTVEAQALLNDKQRNVLSANLYDARTKARAVTGWRIEGTLREFPTFPPKRVLFDFPLHYDDENNYLANAKADGEQEERKSKPKKEKNNANDDKKSTSQNKLAEIWETLAQNDPNYYCHVYDLAELMEITADSVRRIVRKNKDFECVRGFVSKCTN